MAHKYMERCSTSLNIRRMQVKKKHTVRYHCHLLEWPKYNIMILPYAVDAEKPDHTYVASEKVKWYNYSGK